jgi:hypothetical protein
VWAPVFDGQPVASIGALAVAPSAGPAGGGVFAPPAARLTGTFTARLTVDGKTYTRQFTVKPDPRQRA